MRPSLLSLALACGITLLPLLAFAQARTKPSRKPVVPAPSASTTPAAPTSGAESADEKKRRARDLFERGLDLSADEEWDAALAEYLASIQLYPTKAATKNAGLCLRRLGRYDEALDMFESLPKDFTNLTDLDRTFAEKQMQQILPFVGTIEVRGGEPGASVSIDGRERGTLPLPAALRVSAGSHVARTYKEGFAPFETRVTVAGRTNQVVSVRLTPLASAGRLRVVEQTGKPASVVVDNVVVGPAPWEGLLALGDHTVSLRGEGNLGTQPASAPVRVNDVTMLTLRTEPLDAELRVDPTPAGAQVALDGVAVGRGVWEGRLRTGAHRVEVGDEGFVPSARSVTLQNGQRQVVAVELARDESSPLWRVATPSTVFVDLVVGAVIGPTLGGDVVASCKGSCSQGLLFGEASRVALGYELGFGLGFSVDAGYAWSRQSLSMRPDTLNLLPTGSALTDSGTSGDRLTLQGVTLGASASFRTRSRLRWLFRLGAGVWLAQLGDVRTGQFVTSSTLSERPDGTHGMPTSYSVGPIEQSSDARYLYFAPEVRVGLPFGEHLELSAGVAAWFALALTQPTWNPDASQVLTGNCQPIQTAKCVSDGLATWGAQALAGAIVVLPVPTLGARYTF